MISRWSKMHRGYLRNKIGNRIEGIRNRSRQDTASASASDASGSASSAPSFSQLQRMSSADGGFLLVEDSEARSSLEEEEEEEEDGGHHLALEQHGVGDDPLSDIDRELEELVIPDEEDGGEQPRPKAEVGGVKEEEVVKSKPWQKGSQEVYEQQLELLQGHLTTAMIENQNLQGSVSSRLPYYSNCSAALIEGVLAIRAMYIKVPHPLTVLVCMSILSYHCQAY